ncbi:MAG: RluA family pseudouridine synthase [Clostridia bacterium]|nr:RluA family pseudouridine synthase [Clostridia bacterium]
MREYVTVGENDVGKRADVFLSEHFSVTRTAAARLLDEGAALVNESASAKNRKLKAGDTVSLELPPVKETETLPQNIPLSIVYEDDDIAVIDKPKGMVVHPAAGNEDGTLVNALLYHMGERLSGIGGELRPGIVHRIDKDTSGLLVIAKNDFAHNILSEGLKTHSIDREYMAVASGNFRDDSGTVNKPIDRNPKDRKKMAVVAGGREAITHYTVAERFGQYTLLKVKLETGRTHQIRVHMSSIGHPLLGDEVYGGKANLKIHLEGQTLHAYRLTLTHPRTGELMTFESPLPEYFEKILEKLRKL